MGMPEYTLSFRVAGYFYEKVKSGEKRFELRNATPFWSKRADKARTLLSTGNVAVAGLFFSGPGRMHRRTITSVLLYADLRDAVEESWAKDIRARLDFPGPVWKFNLGDPVQ
jgi:hypothetical protein